MITFTHFTNKVSNLASNACPPISKLKELPAVAGFVCRVVRFRFLILQTLSLRATKSVSQPNPMITPSESLLKILIKTAPSEVSLLYV
jgi:hypothetical protein